MDVRSCPIGCRKDRPCIEKLDQISWSDIGQSAYIIIIIVIVSKKPSRLRNTFRVLRPIVFLLVSFLFHPFDNFPSCPSHPYSFLFSFFFSFFLSFFCKSTSTTLYSKWRLQSSHGSIRFPSFTIIPLLFRDETYSVSTHHRRSADFLIHPRNANVDPCNQANRQIKIESLKKKRPSPFFSDVQLSYTHLRKFVRDETSDCYQ